jgi:hypothetical protein
MNEVASETSEPLQGAVETRQAARLAITAPARV